MTTTNGIIWTAGDWTLVGISLLILLSGFACTLWLLSKGTDDENDRRPQG